MDWFVYIVQAKDNSLYTGVTVNIQRRIYQHNFDNKNGAKSLRGKRPVHLQYVEQYNSQNQALKREKEIKGWGREKKLALIKTGLKKFSVLT